MSAPAVQLEGLTKRFSAVAGVFDLDLEVPVGQVFGFLGPNGAGKTTTIRMMLDYLRPQRGTARLLDLDCQRQSMAIRARIGYLPAEFNLYGWMTGEGLLAYLARYRASGSLQRAYELAERLRMPLGGRIRTYSKGMKQKVALIQAMMHDPELLILDEPSEGFDPLIQDEFHGMLREARERGRTVLLSSHVLSEVEAVCDRVGIIGSGRLMAVEPIESLKASRLKRLTLRLAGATAAVPQLPEARFKERVGDRLVYEVTAPGRELARALGALDVVDFNLEPVRLEEVFQSYYREATP